MHSSTKRTPNSLTSSPLHSPSQMPKAFGSDVQPCQSPSNIESLFCQKPASSKPCEKFGLDPKKLENQDLLKFRSYRRLYNIVANDQTEANQVFRPNLIKQLYFLLQITPFIENSLKDNFLNKIEQWYNSNDHKKIKLSKNLDKMMKNMLQSKQKQQKQLKKSVCRPKTGIKWDTSLNPFLRPYTAKLRTSTSSGQCKTRPESSKNGASTYAYTNFMQEAGTRLEEEEGNLNDGWGNMNSNELEEICDIEAEWERSLDFKNNHRTLHPEEEPTYQKLMNLISAVKQKMDEQENSGETAVKQYKGKQYWENKRKIQSAVMAKKIENAKALAEEELQIQNEIKLSLDPEHGHDLNDDGERQEEDQNQVEEEEEQDSLIDFTVKAGKFTSDARARQGRQLRDNNSKMYKMLNGVKILRPFTAKQSNIIAKLDQYSTLEQNKQVTLGNLDRECVQKYKQYMKSKNSIRREIFRKSQSRRYMQNFKKAAQIVPKNQSAPTQDPLNHQTSSRGKENYFDMGMDLTGKKNKTMIGKQTGKVFNFCKMDGDDENTEFILPKYNVKTFFSKSSSNKIAPSCRGIHSLDDSNVRNSSCTKMTYQKRLISQQKFDPLHPANVQNYNQDILEQVEKIKQRFGGKITASTDALIKALYVDDHLYLKEEGRQFVVPDKTYLMIPGEEKKKRKGKLKKVNKKPQSQSRR